VQVEYRFDAPCGSIKTRTLIEVLRARLLASKTGTEPAQNSGYNGETCLSIVWTGQSFEV
jgi:hypothetical protein